MFRPFHDGLGEPLPLRPEDERDLPGKIELVQRRRSLRDKRHAHAGRIVEREQRHAEDRAGRGPERLRAEWICATLGERDCGAERVRGTQERPDVSRIGDAPECQCGLPLFPRQRGRPEDTDDAGRMSQRRDGGEQLGLDRLARNEELDRLDPGSRCGLDEVLTLDCEEPELLALPFLRQELPDELQRRVRR